MKQLYSFLQDYVLFILLTSLIAISTFSFMFFVSTEQNLLYGDALSRLNISRKIIDNLTPGLAQLGNIWLPLPQVFMLPFVWSDYLWHSGVAGAIMSMTAFIVGGYFIYKSVLLLTGSKLTSFFGTLVYALNINLLYLQTTAMSETLFISFLSAIIYFSLAWSKTQKPVYLIFWAFFTSLITLVRYEGLAILGSSIVYVILFSIIGKNKKRIESNAIIYTTLAGLGFFAWTLYLTIIFGDPLYWKNYYAAPQVISTTASIEFVQNLSFLSSLEKYFVSLVWMNGLITVAIGILGFLLIISNSIIRKTISNLSLLLPLSIYIFMVLTLMRNTPIKQPDLTIANILSPSTSILPEFNIRYGIILLPLFAILFAYVFSIKYRIVKLVVASLLLVQVYTYFFPIITIIYQLPLSIGSHRMQGSEPALLYMNWLKKNYDGGLIMISALKHDPQMFQLGLDYKTYIHEGTGVYWKESIKDPSKYATWVVMYVDNPEDQVTKYINKSRVLKSKYNIVYDHRNVRIYKIKDKPQFEIQ